MNKLSHYTPVHIWYHTIIGEGGFKVQTHTSTCRTRNYTVDFIHCMNKLSHYTPVQIRYKSRFFSIKGREILFPFNYGLVGNTGIVCTCTCTSTHVICSCTRCMSMYTLHVHVHTMHVHRAWNTFHFLVHSLTSVVHVYLAWVFLQKKNYSWCNFRMTLVSLTCKSGFIDVMVAKIQHTPFHGWRQ